jgi:peptidoglycan hydrolase CwlO-like protein
VNARAHTRRRVGAALAALVLTAAGAACLATPAFAAPGQTTLVVVSQPKSLSDLDAESRVIQSQMRALESQLTVASKKYDAASAQLDAIDVGLTQTRLKLAGAQNALDAEQALLAQRVASIYKLSDWGWLDAFAHSGSLADFQAQVTVFRSIIEQGTQAQQRLEQLTTQVQLLEQTSEARRQQAVEVQADIDAARALVAGQIAQRRALLEHLVSQIQSILASQGQAALTAPVLGGYTPFTWAQALLQDLGMPVTSANLAAVTAWEMAEGGHWHNSAHYNPLNTTMREPGATSMNSVGVKSYTSWAQGFTATIATLHDGYYADILAALQNGTDAQAVADAVAASPWGTQAFVVGL